VKKLTSIIAALLATFVISGCEQEFAIRDIVPAVGVIGGGEPVEIRGTGFRTDLGISVHFGNQKADNVVVSGPEKLLVTTPSSPGPTIVDIRISTDDGREYLLKRAFRYIEKGSMDIRDLGARRSQREKRE
jgi:hypothetical protein